MGGWQQQITDLGSLVPGRFHTFIKKICTLIVEMGGNLEKRCTIMRGWDIVFVHTAGKTLLK